MLRMAVAGVLYPRLPGDHTAGFAESNRVRWKIIPMLPPMVGSRLSAGQRVCGGTACGLWV
jgi:hypothetical protein